jgi:diguanylate cyclase (GGDEF)-like protein
MRRSDSFCRWGGEEFLLVMPDCDSDHASQAINRVLNAVRANREPLPITASVGAFTLSPGGSSTVAQALKYADAALYTAKQGGRDQLRIAPGPVLGDGVLAA